jgi:hypothetical protein
MNDRIKELLENAEQSDSMAKLKWRIENREQLRQQRKKELMELIERDKKDPFEWLIHQLQQTKDWQRVINEANQKSTSVRNVVHEARVMYKAQSEITENTSDGYHTFKELYEFRKAYNVALFNDWAKQEMRNPKWANPNEPSYLPKYNVHKSWKHNDGELCFGGGWFIVVAVLPTGQISNHYKAEDWDLFQIPETEKALFKFDGHTTDDVINRLINLNK